MIILNEIHQYICEIEKNKLDEWLEENKKIVIEQDEDKALVKNAYQAGFVSIVGSHRKRGLGILKARCLESGQGNE